MHNFRKRGEEDVFSLSLPSAALAKDIGNESKFTDEKVEVGIDPIWHVC